MKDQTVNQESASRRTCFALDRLSNDALLRSGLATIVEAIQPPADEIPAEPPYVAPAEIAGTIYVLQAPPLGPGAVQFVDCWQTFAAGRVRADWPDRWQPLPQPPEAEK